MFHCYPQPDGTYSMQVQPDIQCFAGGRWATLTAFGILGILFYGTGLPALYQHVLTILVEIRPDRGQHRRISVARPGCSRSTLSSLLARWSKSVSPITRTCSIFTCVGTLQRTVGEVRTAQHHSQGVSIIWCH